MMSTLYFEELSVEEAININGGGMAGPPASYWMQDLSPSQVEAVSDLYQKTFLSGAKFILNYVLGKYMPF